MKTKEQPQTRDNALLKEMTEEAMRQYAEETNTELDFFTLFVSIEDGEINVNIGDPVL